MSKPGIDLVVELQRFRSKLLDLSLRNPLLNYRKTSRRTLQIVDELPDHVFRRMVEQSKAMKLVPDTSLDIELDELLEQTAPRKEGEEIVVPEPPRTKYSNLLPESDNDRKRKIYGDDSLQTNIATLKLQSLMRGMARAATATINETGINYLHLAIGFLRWRETESGTGESASAPLILIPVELHTTASPVGGYDYHVQWNEDDIQTNASLRKKFDNDFGLTLPELGEEQAVEEYFAEIRELIGQRKGWSVEREMILGFFSFHKLSMYADIAPEQWQEKGALEESSLAGQLIAGSAVDSGVGIYAADYDVDDHSIAKRIELPLDADSSQHSAITDIAEGKNLVIEGPPGTGKSQTIANAIAYAIEQGKSVLFVAEKLAALEVVYKRLAQAGLADFCLELHGHSVAPKRVMESLANRLGITLSSSDTTPDLRSRLDRYREKLRQYLIASSTAVGPFREPLYDLLWRIVQLRQQGVESRPSMECSLDITAEPFQEACGALEAFSKVFKEYEKPRASAWWGYFPRELAPTESLRILQVMQRMKLVAEALGSHFDVIKKAIGSESNALREFLQRVDRERLGKLAALPFPSVPLEIPQLANPQLQQRILEWVEAQEGFRLASEVIDKELSHGQTAMGKVEPLITPALVQICSALPSEQKIWQVQETRLWIKQTLQAIEKIKGRISVLGRLSFTGIDRFDDYDRTVKIVHFLQNPIIANETAVSKDLFFDSAIGVLAKAKKKGEELVSRRDKIRTLFHMSSVPDSERVLQLLKQYRASGNSWLRIFDQQYRDTIREIRQFSNFPSRYKYREIVSALESLEGLDREERAFEKDSSLRQLLGSFFQGLDTDWEKVRELLQWIASAKKFGLDGNRIQQVLDQRLSLEALPAKELKDELQQLQGQFAGAIAGYLGYESSSWSMQRIDAIEERLHEQASQLDRLDSLIPHLIRAKETQVSDLPRIYRAIQEYRIQKGTLERPLASASTEEKVALEAIHAGKGDFRGAITWLRELQQLPSGNSIAEGLRNSDPSKLCFDLLHALEVIGSKTNEWESLRLELIGNASVEPGWMAGTEQGIPKPDVPEQLQKLELEKDRLPSWLAFCRIFDRCKRCGVIDFAMATVREEIPEETLCQTYQLTLLERIGNQQLEQTGIGFSFTAEEMEEFRKSFQFYDRQLMKSKSLDIQSKMKGQYIPEGNAKGRVGELTELSLIRHEIAKKTRHCRIRDLMLRAGNSVQALKPCFLMSPLSLSRYIPSDSLKFDLVIMDEASQIKPEDAIGAILRARQLVVVGDPKQLPPTSFFDQLNEEIEDEEATQFDNAESILEVAMRSFQPYRRLRWHYRSRHEDLIEFSNERFYDRDLVIFPSAVGRSRGYGIQYHFVEDATCSKGVNVVEAQAIVQRIVEHARSNPTESLGVAAFNQKQAEVIQDLLDEACDSSNEVSDAIAKLRELDDELFVKNLESIQGDERDVMFISYTYGPDPATGRVFQRFGPINSDQGWRRLNVMVTRARKRMEVFSSLKSGDIQGGPDKSRGVNAYKQFLEFVQSGRISEVGAETGRPPGSPFEEAVAKVICECGLEPVFQVGVAGYFIDIGVRKKEGDRDFVLGIECDGASYHSSRSVRDRDRLREEIIQSRGWKLYRIWSTEWFLNQSQEEARLKRFLTALTVDPLIDGKSS